jgi:sigma-E factor negative regulatory protein RseA
MADQSMECAERVSALVDGQLQGDEFVQALAELESSSEARSNWDTYHLLGDVMRAGGSVVRTHDADFVLRLHRRMAADTTESIAVQPINIRTIGTKDTKYVSANESSWRRIAGVASVALASVLAWQGLHWASSSDSSAAPQLAQQDAAPSEQLTMPASLADTRPTTVGQPLIRSDGSSALAMASETPVMIRDPKLDALLAAHRQFGGTSALQIPAGFLRRATFEEGPR